MNKKTAARKKIFLNLGFEALCRVVFTRNTFTVQLNAKMKFPKFFKSYYGREVPIAIY